jgi:hypothetical protein
MFDCQRIILQRRSLVDVAPGPNNISKLGPFNIDWLTGCYNEHAAGRASLTCVSSFQYSFDCFFDGATGCPGLAGIPCAVSGED